MHLICLCRVASSLGPGPPKESGNGPKEEDRLLRLLKKDHVEAEGRYLDAFPWPTALSQRTTHLLEVFAPKDDAGNCIWPSSEWG